MAVSDGQQALITPDLGDGLPSLQPEASRPRAFSFQSGMTPAFTFLQPDKTGAVVLNVHVIPNARHTSADGAHDGALRVRLHAPPVDGKANQALIAWVAQTLGIAKSQVSLLRGQTSKRKQLQISASACAQAHWQALLPSAQDSANQDQTG